MATIILVADVGPMKSYTCAVEQRYFLETPTIEGYVSIFRAIFDGKPPRFCRAFLFPAIIFGRRLRVFLTAFCGKNLVGYFCHKSKNLLGHNAAIASSFCSRSMGLPAEEIYVVFIVGSIITNAASITSGMTLPFLMAPLAFAISR